MISIIAEKLRDGEKDSLTFHANRTTLQLKTKLYTWQYRLRERYIVARCQFEKSLPVPTGMPLPPKYAAFVLVGMLGDTIMCLPVLETAREIWPDARLCAIVTPRIREMLSGLSYIDELLIGTADPLSIRGKGEIAVTKAMIEEKHFDAAFMLGGDQYAPLFYRAGVPVRVGPAPCVYTPLFTHSYLIDDGQTWGPNERLGALRALGLNIPMRVPNLCVNDQMVAAYRRKRETAWPNTGRPFVVIHPFGSSPRQRWPLERVPQLARQIRELTGMDSILIGGPEFRGVASSVIAAPGLINTVGELTISELLGAIKSAALVITTDSGPFHIAGALRKPVIGLFRISRPEHAHRYPDANVLFGVHPSCKNQCRWDRCEATPCRQLESLSLPEVMNRFEKVCEEKKGIAVEI